MALTVHRTVSEPEQTITLMVPPGVTVQIVTQEPETPKAAHTPRNSFSEALLLRADKLQRHTTPKAHQTSDDLLDLATALPRPQ